MGNQQSYTGWKLRSFDYAVAKSLVSFQFASAWSTIHMPGKLTSHRKALEEIPNTVH